LEGEVPPENLKELILVAKVIYERLIEKSIYRKFGYKISIPIEIEIEAGFSMNKMKKWDGAKATLDKFQAYFVKENRKRR